MSYPSSADIGFLSTARQWIDAGGEVLVLIRHHAAAGSKDFELFGSFPAFQSRVESLPPRTSIIVFRDRQLPLRGPVDAGLISAALTLVPDGIEWLVVSLLPTTEYVHPYFHHAAGETHAELREELEAQLGVPTAVGAYPPWLEDSESVISAVVPDGDGSIVPGIY